MRLPFRHIPITLSLDIANFRRESRDTFLTKVCIFEYTLHQYFVEYINLIYCDLVGQMGSDGVEPPEPEGSRFTVCPASTYSITTQIFILTLRIRIRESVQIPPKR